MIALRSLSIASLLAIALAARPAAAAPAAGLPAAVLPAAGPIARPTGSKIFDGGIGFAWGWSGNSFAVARTRDGGATWDVLDLTPAAIRLDALTLSPVGGRPSSVTAHFSDPDRGWLAWSEDEALLRVATTSDGGASWRIALSLPTDAIIEKESYPGPGRACLSAEMAEGMMGATMVVLATDDFGASWSSSSLEHGNGVSGLAFRSATEGFLSINYPSGIRILFYRSTDGGKSWQAIDLPLPPDLPELGGTRPEAPVFSGPGLLNGRLSVALFLGLGWSSIAYRTADGGQTWTYSK